MKIFINPGHAPDNADPGACDNGLKENEVARKIGNKVTEYLKAAGYQVVCQQIDGLQKICNAANNSGADLFVSIHCNSAENKSAKGAETFHYAGSDKGYNLALAIQSQLIKSISGLVDRKVKTANYAVLRGTNMPGVLVETAFISNADDAKFLSEKPDEFAGAIARGITDYVAKLKPAPDVVDKPANATGKLSEHFTASEFACHHCGKGGEKMNPKLIELLEKLRSNIGGRSLYINSGYRCPVHNANVDGRPKSQHVLANAADVAVPAGMSFGEFKWYIDQLPFDGVGTYPSSNFIHVDVRNGGIGSHIPWDEKDYM